MSELKILAAAACTFLISIPVAGHTATIDVLWTSGTDAYDASMQSVADRAATYDPDGDGALSWNLTFWDGTSDPGFENYDAFVIGSTCNSNGTGNCSGSAGFFGNGVYADGVLAYGDEIEAARGDDSRTFLSGQDADFHQFNNLPGVDNGPQGFIINAVNWAASGVGLGIVSMTADIPSSLGSDWWTLPDSFLADEIPVADVFAFNSETVNIGAGQENFPVNEGLTSAGLSNWSTSSHACFNEIAGFTRINFAPQGAGECGVTIVTSGAEGGDTGGGDSTTNPIPLPAGIWLMMGGLGLLGAQKRRAKA
ncbi:VPLPA-CTERM sorting domain-containing protein [Roseobacter ponti]|uniref:VPLPA-CTERM sorting domain-containing protein n=1 Tax=Roseobacter ponti TaxID=1891787 RepID=A0A858SR44_9RHOB|nr:VPLPA-CTERM sorting domain-containing protein [Roseobacter ponti]QJF51339.1 VPLPA-CTERM sorting domain-containing protein [Roseobacter ponti]